MTAILRLQLDDKDPVRVNSAINQLAEVIDRGGGGGGGSGRTLLTANTTFYVATTGSDANPGTVGSPFLTIQHAYDVIVHTIDTAGFTITISCASGTYTTGLAASSSWTGGGPIILDLGGGTINSSADCINVSTTLPSALQIKNGTLTSSANSAIRHSGAGIVIVGTGVTFGSATSGNHMYSEGSGSLIRALSPYTISGSVGQHFLAVKSGNSIQASTAVTLTGTLTISVFAYATRLAGLEVQGMTFSGSTPTGARYIVDTNAVIFTAGGGANYFPGTAAGAPGSGGIYA